MNRKERREAMREALTRRVEQRLAERTTVAVHRAVDPWEALGDELARQLLGLPDVVYVDLNESAEERATKGER